MAFFAGKATEPSTASLETEFLSILLCREDTVGMFALTLSYPFTSGISTLESSVNEKIDDWNSTDASSEVVFMMFLRSFTNRP